MKIRTGLLTLILVCALLSPAAVSAQPPPMPVFFEGTVKITGVDAPIGTIITAEIGAVEVATNAPGGTVGSGYYYLTIPNNGYDGQMVTFKVNGEVGGQHVYNYPPGASWIVPLAVVDSTPPTVTGAPTGSSEPVNTVVTATFSEPMNTVLTQTAFSIAPNVAGSFSWVGNVMTFTPAGNLDYNTKYTATIAVTAQDVVGNPLASAKSWSFTTVKGPYLYVAKTASPYVIGRKGSGLTPEVSTVTLTVTRAGDPSGSLTSVVVTDVLPDYINYEGNPSIATTTETVIAGVTTLTWNVGTIAVGVPWTVTFDISSDDCGRVLANEYNLSNVTYLDATSTPVTVLFPKTYLFVRCPEEVSIGIVAPAAPAEISVSNIGVNPEQVVQTGQVEVSVSIGNSGGVKGTKTVALYVNGAFEDSQTVSVGPGGGQVVLFWVSRAVPGTYTVSVEGREAQFTVLGMGPPQSAPAPPQASAGMGGGLGTGGIVAIIVVVIALAVGLVVILRREST